MVESAWQAYPFDLGSLTRPIGSDSEQARAWCVRGLVWAYGFNHEEALACFERAAAADPQCAFAHFGAAYVLGPNYNNAWAAFAAEDLADVLPRARAFARRADELVERALPVERALIATLAARYPADSVEGQDQDWPLRWAADWAEAMRAVRAAFPDDLDVLALTADALMGVTPWALWDLRSGEPAAGANTAEVTDLLTAALERPEARAHPGVLHFYIHAMEMSATPERALIAADLLRPLVPDSGHLIHMPTHIDVLCGDYRRVVESNLIAEAADRRYLEHVGTDGFYSLYRAHDLHFVMYGAMFQGQSGTAIAAGERLERLALDALDAMGPSMADWLEGFVPMRLHALIRFGRWEQILSAPLRAVEQFPFSAAMTRYARGVALAATGQVTQARLEQDLFAEAVAAVPPTRMIFNNTCQAIAGIAAQMLAGEIAYREGDHDRAFEHLRAAVACDDVLPYDEPWGWMQPARHALGALLLEQDRVEQAEAVYRADLGLDDTVIRSNLHPDNVWSLHGYHECLTRLGKHELAAAIRLRLDIALAQADVPVISSCACRGSASQVIAEGPSQPACCGQGHAGEQLDS